MNDSQPLACPYGREKELVDEICSALASRSSPWGPVAFTREFGYARGRADLVAVDLRGRVLAFEAKLHRWRDALHQAYRNTCFAHCSYVVLPAHSAKRASRHRCEFRHRAVGLCVMTAQGVEIVVSAAELDPLQPWLAQVATNQATLNGRE